ncbi:putative reverse transcriptase domain-containing protein [Tanacetum coccineum]
MKAILFRNGVAEGTKRVCSRRGASYHAFMKCKPLYFKGTEGVVELTQWFERMETVFRISNCSVENQIKERDEKLDGLSLWNLKVKGTDVIGYNQRFQELALLCVRMFPEESDKIERSAGNANNQRGTGSGQKPTCFECGVQGHFKRECPKLKNNKNHGNQVGNDRAPAKVYAVGHAGTNPDSNVVTGMFLLNNRYASILFDTGVDRSFVSTAFSYQIDITPSILDHYYDVELADKRIIGLNIILRGCHIKSPEHPFQHNFNAHSIVVSTLYWYGLVGNDGSNRGHEARLHIISYSKTQEYMLKGCPVFLAHVTTKEVEDKSEKKRLEDVPIVQDFS